jgi:hypothetical protein
MDLKLGHYPACESLCHIVHLCQTMSVAKTPSTDKLADHPELKDGAAAWVRTMRAESEKRLELIKQHWDRDAPICEPIL